MELYIHYQQLPQGKELADVVGELNEVLEDNGSVCGGRQGRIDLDLEDERVNPKYAQIAVKASAAWKSGSMSEAGPCIPM